MPLFTYRGRARALVLAGRRLAYGVPTNLTGRAAERAAEHPDVIKGDGAKAKANDQTPATALTDIAAYLESGTADVGELTTKLVKLDEATLAELAKEYDVAGPVEGTALTDLANAMLADDGGEATDEKLTGKALDDKIAELKIDASKGGSNADGSMSADEKRAAIAKAQAS